LKNEDWSHSASFGVRVNAVIAIRTMRSGLQCFGNAAAICSFIVGDKRCCLIVIAALGACFVSVIAVAISGSPLKGWCCDAFAFWKIEQGKFATDFICRVVVCDCRRKCRFVVSKVFALAVVA
jgi:hypothetical protein